MIIIINNEIPENENPKKSLIFDRVIKFNKEQEEQDLKH